MTIPSHLLSLSPLDGRYASYMGHLPDFLSEYALNKARVLIEIRWFISLSNNTTIKDIPSLNEEEHHFLEHMIETFSLTEAEQIKVIEKTTNHDVKAVEYWIKEKIRKHPTLSPYCEFVHFACTSEDINNLAYAYMIKNGQKSLVQELKNISNTLCNLAETYAYRAMLARTHGQSASPTTLGKEIAVFIHRLNTILGDIENTPITAKMNGAVGNYHAHAIAYPNIDWIEHTQNFVESLGFSYCLYSTQVEPQDTIAKIFCFFSQLNMVLIDLCRDFWGYISLGYIKQKAHPDEIGSSTMPHKINPIDFENAESNLGFSNNLFQYFSRTLPISRWQRDLTDSTLKRNIGLGVGHSFLAYAMLSKGLSKISVDEKKIDDELNNSWEVITEALQSVMRRYAVPDAYEKVKNFSRGQTVTKEKVKEFINQLPLPKEEKERLQKITPHTYIGYAPEIALRAVRTYRTKKTDQS